MEERYEIRGKIGQGGLGAVYKGYDTRMSREVAIKRISVTSNDPELQEESTRQLIKEAGALASLQHPHIVTIYDVGADEDGPYVVMELISGKTLDELIETAPLTWQDFRELALQTQEALIAAQELDLIHSDLKPSNLMLTWLPSGKFQVKIVDFGLATLTHTQSKEDIEELEAVFGSIFFMAPEQFERVPLDARADMYALGCVYYQALTGHYPFNGETGHEVMTAHLQHTVTPIQEIRPNIPVWACDWIMWHINRQAADRPASARESLHVFLQNDKVPNPKLSLGTAPPAQSSQRAPLVVRGGGPQPIRIPRPSTPAARNPLGQTTKQIIHSGSAPIPTVAPPTTLLAHAGAVKTTHAPQALKPPEGSKPSVYNEPKPLPKPEPAPSHTGPIYVAATTAIPPEFLQHKKPKFSKRQKTNMALVIGVCVVVMSFVIFKLTRKDASRLLYDEMLTTAGKKETTELTVDKTKLDILLKATTAEATAQDPLLYKALAKAKAGDATDVDGLIATFALKRPELPADVRGNFIREVLRKRKSPAAAPALLEYALAANDPALAAAAVQAIRYTATEDQFSQLLDLLQTTANDDIRKASEEALAEIIRKNAHRNALSGQLGSAYINGSNMKVRESLLRLLARCGGDQATMLVKSSLNSPELESKSAAISALGVWADESAYPILLDILANSQDAQLRGRAFDSAFLFAAEPRGSRKPEVIEALWTQLAAQAKTADQQKKLIGGLADYGSETWAYQLISAIAKNTNNDASVIQVAEQTLNRLRSKN